MPTDPLPPLTTEEVAELRRLEQAATPGPWSSIGRDVISGESRVAAPQATGDADLIAAARNALPRLLNERERMSAEIVRLGDLVAKAREEGWRAGREAAFSAVYAADVPIPSGPESPLPPGEAVGPVVGMHWARDAHLRAIRDIPEPNP